MQPQIQIYSDKDALVLATAEMMVATIAEAIAARGACAVALSGGSTPRDVYETLAQEDFQKRIDWSRVHWFWGDERMVPPDHAESNFRMAQETLFAHVNAPASNVHRIKGELAPQLAAQDYREKLEVYFKGKEKTFDLILLGLGEDGHTASLFPETSALHETTRTVTEVLVPKFDKWRVTFTLPLINQARKAVFLVAGKAKAEIVANVLGLTQPHVKWPASLVQPRTGILQWWLDAEAASQIKFPR